MSDIRCTCIRTKYFGLRQKTRFLVSKLFKFFFSFLRCAPPCHCCRSPLFPFFDIRIHVLNGEPNIYITTLVGRVTILFLFLAYKYRMKRVLLLLTAVSSFLYFPVPRLTVKNIENLRYKRRPVIHKCTRCGKGYQLETSLRRHQRLECGVEPRQSCQICGKKFTHRFKLTHHLASCRRKREYYGTI